MKVSRHLRIGLVLQQIARAALSRDDPRAPQRAARLTHSLEELGPTFIKLGQMLSSRPDLFTETYLDSLQHLQDAVQPFPVQQAIATIEKDLGRPLASLFTDFRDTPMACASLAQVHSARATGLPELAVKVQRPGLRATIDGDIALLRTAALVLDRTRLGEYYSFSSLVKEFQENTEQELDFTIEAANIKTIAHNLRNFEHIVLPTVIDGLTGPRVLTATRIPGTRVTRENCSHLKPSHRKHLAHELLRAYLKQVVEDGFFHADPHMGNVILTEDGKIALIDPGIIGIFDEGSREKVGKLVFAFARLRSEEVVGILLDLGAQTEQTNLKELQQDVRDITTHSHHMKARHLGVGKAMIDLATVAVHHHVRLPRGFLLLSRTFFYLDRLCWELDPTLDYTDFLAKSSPTMYMWMGQRHFGREALTESTFEFGRLAAESGGKLNTLLDKLITDQVAIRFEHEHLYELTQTIKRAANRLSFALVIAALIIGSALLARFSAGPRIFGFSLLGAGGFLLAALLGLYLLIKILSAERL